MIDIEHPGLLTTIQDRGRAGFQHLGLSPGGAMDPDAARMANLLVGNDPSAALLEITLMGPRLIFRKGVWIALTGADLSATLSDASLPLWRPVWAPAGTCIGFGRPRRGCRAYLAVDGGIDVPQVLGSRSTDARAAWGGLTGRSLQVGDRLPLGTAHLLPPQHQDQSIWPCWWVTSIDHAIHLRFIPGTDWAALAEHERQELAGNRYRISNQCDRMGLRLSGPALSLPGSLERLSAGVTFGTIQLPPDGQPIVLGPDRQTTGGYPVLGTVARIDWPCLGQLRPGDAVGFTPITVDAAHALLRDRERDIARLATGLSLRWPLSARTFTA
jgi:antagonist of KipI